MTDGDKGDSVARTEWSVRDAVAEAARTEGSAFVFLSAMDRFEVGSLEGGTVRVMRPTADGRIEPTEADIDAAYELRIFGPKADFHWRREGAVGSLAVRRGSDPSRETIARSYLLWGKADGSIKHGDTSWTKVRASRVKPFWVPVSCGKDHRLALCAVEHVRSGADGNAYVAFERLVGIRVHGAILGGAA